MKINKNLILSLDIGSNQIRALVCEIDQNREIFVKTFLATNSKGLVKGKIVNPVEFKNVLDDLVSKITKKLSERPTKVIVNIPLSGLSFNFRTGLLAIKNQEGLVGQFEKNKCIERAKNSFNFVDKQIMHVIPILYKLDNKESINPINKQGHLLEVRTHLISCDQDNIHEFIYILHQLNLKLLGIVYDALGTGEIVIPFTNRKEGAFLMDFGSQFCRISFFKNNLLANSAVIGIGGETISNDLKQCLNVSLQEAERIKQMYIDALVFRINPDEVVEIITNNNERIKVKKILICQIVEARLNELVNLVKKKFPLIKDNYPLFLTGGSSRLKGIDKFFMNKFKLKVTNFIPENVTKVINDQDYLNVLGLLIYGYKNNAFDFVPSKKKATLLEKIKDILSPIFLSDYA